MTAATWRLATAASPSTATATRCVRTNGSTASRHVTTVLISDWLQVKVDCCRRVRVTSPAQPGVAGAYTRAGDHNGHTWYQVSGDPCLSHTLYRYLFFSNEISSLVSRTLQVSQHPLSVITSSVICLFSVTKLFEGIKPLN